jgi:uncharacterized protein (DUF1684 family)
MNQLEEFRLAKDEFFEKDGQSPLTDHQKLNFHGLNYFPENPALHLVLPVEEFETKEKIKMPTSTGEVQAYTRFGKIKFEVEGQPAELTIYASRDGFFLPFVDALVGKETYGAGRYLEPSLAGTGKLLIDFNLAYNPYCAYNENWSCPITPAENRIKVPIQAGEKVFHTE